MKRDFDLIRSILLQAEEAPPGVYLQQISVSDPSITAPIVAQHVALMVEHGLIEGKVYSSASGTFAIGRLTWPGHDFLDAARSDTVWKKAKDQLVAVGGSASIEVFKAILIQITKKQLGIP